VARAAGCVRRDYVRLKLASARVSSAGASLRCETRRKKIRPRHHALSPRDRSLGHAERLRTYDPSALGKKRRLPESQDATARPLRRDSCSSSMSRYRERRIELLIERPETALQMLDAGGLTAGLDAAAIDRIKGASKQAR